MPLFVWYSSNTVKTRRMCLALFLSYCRCWCCHCHRCCYCWYSYYFSSVSHCHLSNHVFHIILISQPPPGKKADVVVFVFAMNIIWIVNCVKTIKSVSLEDFMQIFKWQKSILRDFPSRDVLKTYIAMTLVWHGLFYRLWTRIFAYCRTWVVKAVTVRNGWNNFEF